MNYYWFNQQRKNGQKLIENSLEWKLRDVKHEKDLSQTPKILGFMNKEKTQYTFTINRQT